MKYLVKQACRIEHEGVDHYWKLDAEVEISPEVEANPCFDEYVATGWLIPLEFRPPVVSAAPVKVAAPKAKSKPAAKKPQKTAKPVEIPNSEVVA